MARDARWLKRAGNPHQEEESFESALAASPRESILTSADIMSSDEAQRFIDEVWGLQGTAYLVLGLRYYSRIVTLGWGKLALDDFLMALATVCCSFKNFVGASLS